VELARAGPHERFANSILQSFIGSCGRHVRRDRGVQPASVWMFVDHVLLTFQEPVYVTIGIRDGSSFMPVYSNLSTQDRDFLGLRKLEDEQLTEEEDAVCIRARGDKIRIAVRYLPRDWPAGKGRMRPQGWDSQLSQDIVRELAEEDTFSDMILKALEHIAGTKSASHIDQTYDPRHPNSDDAATDVENLYANLISNRLAPLLDNLATCHLTQSPSGRYLNFFVVYRRPGQRVVYPPRLRYDRVRTRIKYPFSAGILLTNEQRRQLREFGAGFPDDISSALGDSERSLSDTPLVGGNIDFSLTNEATSNRWSRSYHPRNASSETAIQRSAAENVLYSLAFDDMAPLPPQRAIFYIPIHLNGRPWFAIFRWFDSRQGKPDEIAWEFDKRIGNVHFYQDIASGIADAMGRATEEAYADAAARTIASAFELAGQGDRFVKTATDSLKALARWYPYDAIEIGQASLGTVSQTRYEPNLELPGLDWALTLKFRESSNYRPLNPELITENVERALQRVIWREAEAFNKTLEVFGHNMGGLMQAAGFGEIAVAADDACRKLGDVPEAHRLSRSIACIESRTKLVQGFSEALRMRKTNGRGFPAQWFSNNTGKVDASAVVEAAERIALFHLWGRWRLERRWQRISIENENGENVYSVDDPYVVERATDLPDLPPFSEPGREVDSRHAGTIVTSLGLAELIFNACDCVVRDLRKNRPRALSPDIPRIHLRIASQGRGKDQCVKVAVINCSAHRPKVAPPKRINEVRQLEERYMRCDGLPVVETLPPSVTSKFKAASDDLCWVEANWAYYFRRVISEKAEPTL
jgi:hypothetical protein